MKDNSAKLRDTLSKGSHLLAIAIAASIALYCISFYFPLSSKAKNNIFYIGIAFPTALWALFNRPETISFLKNHFLQLIIILTLSTLFASDLGDLKTGLYIVSLFLALYIIQAAGIATKALITYSSISLGLFIYFTYNWISISTSSGSWIRYSEFFENYINPVYTSTLIVSSLAAIWILKIEPRTKHSSAIIKFSSLAGLTVIALLCTIVFQSRSTLVGFALFLAAYTALTRQWVLIAVTMSATLVTLTAGGFGEGLLARGLSFRPEIWLDAYVRVTQTCGAFIGCGSDGHQFAGHWSHAHSAYVSTFYRTGLAGTLLFLILLALSAYQGIRRKNPWLLVALIGWGSLLTTTYGVFSSPNQSYWVYFWIPTLLAAINPATPSSCKTPNNII